MRIPIHLSDDQIEGLARGGVSRALLIRRAAFDPVSGPRPHQETRASGLRRDAEDGLALEDRLRAEW
jgi:hypothetical protein